MPEDLTDDEDSDIENFTDDSRSRAKRDSRRPRRNTEQIDLDHRDTEVISRIQRMKEKSKFIRERRSGSLTNWPTTKYRDSGSLTPSDDEIKSATKFRKSSLTSPIPQSRKLLSDSASERETPPKPKNQQKVFQPVKNESASEKEAIKEPTLLNDDARKHKKTVSDSDVERKPSLVPAEARLESDIRPLKVLSSSNANSLKTSNVSREQTNKKEETKVTQAEKAKPVEVNKQSTREAVVDETKTPPAKIEVETKPAAVVELPTEDWECKHCTFVNEAAAKVCVICCKTRVEVLQQLPPEAEDDIDITELNGSILPDDSDAKRGKVRKISFLPGTKAH